MRKTRPCFGLSEQTRLHDNCKLHENDWNRMRRSDLGTIEVPPKL